MDSLHATAQANGLIFGAAAGPPLLTDASLAALYREHCGLITTDIALKWGTVRPSSDMAPVWTQADALLAWAEASNIKVKGHTLIWNEYNPAWLWTNSSTAPNYGALTSPIKVEDAKRCFDQHITETVERYAGRIQIWDVVNEAIEPAHKRSDGMRAKTWMTVWGPKYVERAFARAHAANPSAKLFLNEQSLERFNYEPNRVKFLALVDRLLDAGIPLHGVGLESHLIMWAMVSHEGVLWLVDALDRRGLDVHISELDVAHAGASGQAVALGSDAATIDAAVAEFVAPMLADVMQFKCVKALLTWQLVDKYSWLYSQHPRPLPFDNSYQPKPLAFAIERALINAGRR
ncbi:endo-1,4-beta-xylanase [Bradyrhizobium paxllaeri]|uniref:endo-1,4-beta-xylanase n=1 Tax=Bradyrhizobium paxllaeri TaxID=190148 RepID=UPI0008107BDB|nr:endo-1,4-beta-xylanase [Bradyrhizobium paxllaeri]